MTTTEPAWYRIIECEEEPFPKGRLLLRRARVSKKNAAGSCLKGWPIPTAWPEIMSRHGREKVSEFIRGHKMIGQA